MQSLANMNLPNRLTLMRLVLTAVFVGVMSMAPFHGAYTLGLILFIVAAVTDVLDGHLARKMNLITNFGKLMDPLADKILISAGFVLFCKAGYIPAWVVIAILSREFLVTGLRLLALAHNQVLAADRLGKHKTVWQAITVFYFLLATASNDPWFHWMQPMFSWRPTSSSITGTLLIIISLGLTVWSGVGYLINNQHVLTEKLDEDLGS